MKTFTYTINDKPIEKIIDFSMFENEKNILIQIFCGQTKEKLKNILDVITKKLPQAICIGSSTDGEISNDTITTNSTILSISTFEKTTIKAAYSNSEDCFSNGVELANKLCTQTTKAIIAFSDGATTNGEEFLNGINFVNNKVIVSGGMAADNANFTQTFISCQNKILTKGAVGVSLNSEELSVCNAFNFNMIHL